MLRQRLTAACTLVLLSLLVLTSVPVNTSAAPASAVLLREDAEQATYAEWDASWQRFDLNKDAAGGMVNEDIVPLHDNPNSAHAIYARTVQQPLSCPGHQLSTT